MTHVTITPAVDPETAYRRVVERLAAGEDVGLTEAVEAARAVGKTTDALADDVATLAAQGATECRSQ